LAFPSSPGLYYTWEWQDYAKIRSFVHPLLTFYFYKIIILLKFDTTWIIAWGPRLFHAIICGTADVYFFQLISTLLNFLPSLYTQITLTPPITPSFPKLDGPHQPETPTSANKAKKSTTRAKSTTRHDQNQDDEHENKKSGFHTDPLNDKNTLVIPFIRSSRILLGDYFKSIRTVTLFLWLCNWFSAYCFTRPYSNSIETALIIIALSFWPLFYFQPTRRIYEDDEPTQNPFPFLQFCLTLTISLTFAALSVLFRATSVILWIPLYLIGLYQLRSLPVGNEKSSFFSFLKYSCYFALPVFIGIISILLMIEIDAFGYNQQSPLITTLDCVGNIYGINPNNNNRNNYSPFLTLFATPINLFKQFLSTGLPYLSESLSQSFRLQSTQPLLNIILSTDPIKQCVIGNYSLSSLSLYNFYKINKASNISSLYGEHHWTFSVLVSIPVTTSALLPFVIFGSIHFFSLLQFLFFNTQTQFRDIFLTRISLLFYFSYFLPVFYCTNKHQEYRFILPAVPYLYLFAGHCITYLVFFPPTSWKQFREYLFLEYTPPSAEDIKTLSLKDYKTGLPLQYDNDSIQITSHLDPKPSKTINTMFVILFIINAFLIVFLFCVHQRGPFVVMEELKAIKYDIETRQSHHYQSLGSDNDNIVHKPLKKLGVFLAGCHQIPYPSFFHLSDQARAKNRIEYSFLSPDCSPLFSKPDQIGQSLNEITSVPCWLNRDDQFSILNRIQSGNEPKIPTNCTSPFDKPSFPGKNWVSAHEQAKSHPILFFLRQIVMGNLSQLQIESPDLFAEKFSTGEFYQNVVDLYVQTLSSNKGYDKKDDIILLKSILKQIEPLIMTTRDNSHVNDNQTFDKLVELLQHRRLSHDPDLNTIVDPSLRINDPFFHYSTLFSFPKTLNLSLPDDDTQAQHQSTSNYFTNLFFPDIVVIYTQEQQVMDSLLLKLGYILHTSHLNTPMEPDERDLYVYIQQDLL
jgi:hypothetical protein